MPNLEENKNQAIPMDLIQSVSCFFEATSSVSFFIRAILIMKAGQFQVK